MTERSKFGSRRYGLERRGLYACDSCLDERAYEQPPTGWNADEVWSAGPSSELSPRSSLVLGFGLALFLTALMAALLATKDLHSNEVGALIILYLIGAAAAFITPVRLRVNSNADIAPAAGRAVVGVSLLMIVDRIGDSYTTVDVALACVLAIGSGWGALLTIRYGVENRRRAKSPQTRQRPPGI